MLLAAIIALIILGIILLIVEILIVPGATFVGILGGLFMIAGIYWMYVDFGSVAGNITLFLTIIFTFFSIYISLKSGIWKRLTLKDKLEGRVNILNPDAIKVGDIGVSISALRPMGTVFVNNIRIEAQSTGEFIKENTDIVVVKILANKIIVKPKNQN